MIAGPIITQAWTAKFAMALRDRLLHCDNNGDLNEQIDSVSLEIFRTTAFLHQGCKRK